MEKRFLLVAKYILSAFADEVSPVLKEQLEYLNKQDIGFVEPRNVDGINVSSLSLQQAKDAKKLMDYLNSIGSKVYLYPIEGVPAEWESPLEMFKHKLQHDIKISRLIYVASTIAEENNDNDTLDFLTNFANEQKKEENISRNMIMAFDSVKDDEFAFTLLDKELGEREL
jgi:ferritin